MNPKIEIKDYSLWFGSDQVLKSIAMTVPRNQVVAVFGPAGSGKSGLLRSINRMAELDPRQRHTGDILMDGASIFAPEVNTPALRRKVGMVFAQPTPLPMSIHDNVTYGLRLQKIRTKAILDEAVERSLTAVTLWDEVKDRLNDSGMALSGGQQQRLSIARVLALNPEVLLLDAPTAALDPINTAKIEELLIVLKQDYTVIIVPHSVQQASRVADTAAFFMGGEAIEYGTRNQIFVLPKDKRTENYVSGRFG